MFYIYRSLMAARSLETSPYSPLSRPTRLSSDPTQTPGMAFFNGRRSASKTKAMTSAEHEQSSQKDE